MSDNLDALIQRAEEQKIEMELNLQLQKNLALFADRFPQIHKLVCNRTPTDVSLVLDPNHNINLANISDGICFYNGDPKAICNEQVDQFKRKARVRRFLMTKNKEQNEKHAHIQALNTLIDGYEQENPIRLRKTPAYLPNLIVSGIGLGYHLNALVKNYDIQNILIYENCIDSFYASLHTLDWQGILDYFQHDNRTISLCIGVSPDIGLQQIKSVINNIGLHSQVFTFFYRHSDRQCDKDFIERYDNDMQFVIQGLGYFDDERIGLAHAHHNLSRPDLPVFIAKEKKERDTPVFIVGNGPSLDLHADYLRENQDNAIIISCGTALTSLLRMGINPDFHIEMERPAFIEQAIRSGSTEEQRKNITLLCLHTVAPQTIACFPEACYALKPHDAGNQLVREQYSNTKLDDLVYCNPTVANCALSFVVNMGFINTHLIGIDFGVYKEGQHHSQNSIYYDFERISSTTDSSKSFYQGDQVICEGNFGGEVTCSLVFNNSRIQLETLLSLAKRVNPEFKCINSNHGAKIKHTLTEQLGNLSKLPKIDKHSEIRAIKQDHFLMQEEGNSTIEDDNCLDYFFSIKKSLKLPKNLSTEKQFIDAANKVYKHVAKSKDIISHYLLRGTLNCFIGAIVQHSFFCKSREEFKERLNVGVTQYNNLIEDIYRIMEVAPFDLDDTESSALNRLKKSQAANLPTQQI